MGNNSYRTALGVVAAIAFAGALLAGWLGASLNELDQALIASSIGNALWLLASLSLVGFLVAASIDHRAELLTRQVDAIEKAARELNARDHERSTSPEL